MSPGHTFERVYLAIKDQLVSGRFAPGTPLEPAALGDELNASITPVRDALHRLAGEHLVEAPRHDGFRSPLLSEAALRHLYAWNADLLLLALRGAAPTPPSEPTSRWITPGNAPAPLAASITDLFATIGRLSPNPEHGIALANAGDRLLPARGVESRILGGRQDELDALAQAWHMRDLAPLRRLISAYHARRKRAAPQILEALHDAPHLG